MPFPSTSLSFNLPLVYVFAGIAKLNADWLFEAMPLAIWLPAQDQLPFVGSLFQYKATAYAFSWAGAIYDLTIPFFLLFGRTRWMAYAAVVVFHLLTWSFVPNRNVPLHYDGRYAHFLFSGFS